MNNKDFPLDQNDKPYYGLFGLDKLPDNFKIANFVLTLIVGTGIAFGSWSGYIIKNPLFSLAPFAWPIVLLCGWPIFGVILWLRLTGIKWSLSMLAGCLIIPCYFISIILLLIFGAFFISS